MVTGHEGPACRDGDDHGRRQSPGQRHERARRAPLVAQEHLHEVRAAEGDRERERHADGDDDRREAPELVVGATGQPRHREVADGHGIERLLRLLEGPDEERVRARVLRQGDRAEQDADEQVVAVAGREPGARALVRAVHRRVELTRGRADGDARGQVGTSAPDPRGLERQPAHRRDDELAARRRPQAVREEEGADRDDVADEHAREVDQRDVAELPGRDEEGAGRHGRHRDGQRGAEDHPHRVGVEGCSDHQRDGGRERRGDRGDDHGHAAPGARGLQVAGRMREHGLRDADVEQDSHARRDREGEEVDAVVGGAQEPGGEGRGDEADGGDDRLRGERPHRRVAAPGAPGRAVVGAHRALGRAAARGRVTARVPARRRRWRLRGRREAPGSWRRWCCRRPRGWDRGSGRTRPPARRRR